MLLSDHTEPWRVLAASSRIGTANHWEAKRNERTSHDYSSVHYRKRVYRDWYRFERLTDARCVRVQMR